MPVTPILLTIQQAAERVQLSISTLRRACAVRELAYVKVGRSIRFRPEALMPGSAARS